MIVRTAEELAGMRQSGLRAARVREALVPRVSPGMTTGELGAIAGELIRAEGAESAFLGYRGYPGQICISVNDEVVHGIPGPRRIQVGDIVSLDIGVRYRGFIGDTATTVMVGVADPDVIRLVRTAEQALYAGIERARAGGRVIDISGAIEDTACGAGFSVVRTLVGHGVGRALHEDPQVPNYRSKDRPVRLRPGMTIALEPMVNRGGSDVETLPDKWTVRTKDGRPSAHFEHTILIREDGPAEILTAAPGARNGVDSIGPTP